MLYLLLVLYYLHIILLLQPFTEIDIFVDILFMKFVQTVKFHCKHVVIICCIIVLKMNKLRKILILNET